MKILWLRIAAKLQRKYMTLTRCIYSQATNKYCVTSDNLISGLNCTRARGMRESEKFISNKDPHFQLYPRRVEHKSADRALHSVADNHLGKRAAVSIAASHDTHETRISSTLNDGTRLITLIRYLIHAKGLDFGKPLGINIVSRSVSVILRGLGAIVNNSSIDIQCVSKLLYFLSTTKKRTKDSMYIF